MIYTQESLYQLSPQEFEALCVKVIKEIIPDITDVELVRPSHKELHADIIGKLYGEQVVIEVKHKLRINSQEVQRIFDNLTNSKTNPKHVVLMSSALLKDISHDAHRLNAKEGITYHYIGANDILEVLNTKDINQTELIRAIQRVTKEKKELISSLIVMGISVLYMGQIFYGYMSKNNESPTLTTKIQAVEKSIDSLKDLENQLKDIREDMLAKEKASKLIEKNYQNAQGLKKLTEQELDTLKDRLQSQSWKDIILQNILAFILGISSSIVATILYSRFKRRQVLEND